MKYSVLFLRWYYPHVQCPYLIFRCINQRLHAMALLTALVCSALVPLSAGASSLRLDALRRNASAPITRGDFIRAAVDTVGLSTNSEVDLPYKRPISKHLQPFVGAAYGRGALDVFGQQLLPGNTITIGQALQVLVQLQQLDSTDLPQQFSDVRQGSQLEKAVAVALEKDWATPARQNIFGVNRVLTRGQARILLRRVRGDQQKELPRVTIRFKTKEPTVVPKHDVMQSIWGLLNKHYLYHENIDEEEMAYKAIEAMMSVLQEEKEDEEKKGDRYTRFLRPRSAKDFHERIQGERKGIVGIQVQYEDDALLVVTPIRNSPADKAGIKAGDRIIEVDGHSIAGSNLLDSVARIKGEAGTSVQLKIRRNDRTLDITLKRDNITIPDIEISWQGSVAVVHLAQFGQQTERELRTHLIEINQKKPSGIIVDLRNNPGGLLRAAQKVLGNFLEQGSPIATIVTRESEYTEVTVDPPTVNPGIPVVVLVNGGSASSSEIVAGALQDYSRAIIIGERTFGKGSVQQVWSLEDDSQLNITVAEWFTPAKRKIDGVGITPDRVVAGNSDRDDQMLDAIQVLRGPRKV